MHTEIKHVLCPPLITCCFLVVSVFIMCCLHCVPWFSSFLCFLHFSYFSSLLLWIVVLLLLFLQQYHVFCSALLLTSASLWCRLDSAFGEYSVCVWPFPWRYWWCRCSLCPWRIRLFHNSRTAARWTADASQQQNKTKFLKRFSMPQVIKMISLWLNWCNMIMIGIIRFFLFS